jgi:ADP-dependent NAD(P)H-hydrate dehydratase
MPAAPAAENPRNTPAMPPADLPRLPSRRRDTSKHDYGRVVIVGGAVGMAGAPALAAMAALRSGAGLVEALVPEQVTAIAAGFDPCVMTSGLPGRIDGTFATDALGEIETHARRADAVAVGPGLGRSDSVIQIVVHLWRHLPQPAIFDADALWALAHIDRGSLASHAGPRILTPHAGEMLRLLGADPSSGQAGDRAMLEREAVALAGSIDAVIVLKGPATLITDRTRQTHNDTGNPGMATAGTGDVLTGVTAALLGQRLSPFEAAWLAAWVHGRAGDVAAESLGEISMTARDLLDRLHVAFRDVSL